MQPWGTIIWVFPKIVVPLIILIGFSIINHPFWGTPIFGNTHLDPIMVCLLKMTTCYPLSRACDSAMALGLPDVFSVKNVVPAFSQVLCHGRITYYTYYTGTIFQDCHKRTHWHELRWHEQLVSWKSKVKINKHLWKPSFEPKFITGRCELMSNFNWSAVVSSRRLEAK